MVQHIIELMITLQPKIQHIIGKTQIAKYSISLTAKHAKSDH
jgi:hypothetical protein